MENSIENVREIIKNLGFKRSEDFKAFYTKAEVGSYYFRLRMHTSNITAIDQIMVYYDIPYKNPSKVELLSDIFFVPNTNVEVELKKFLTTIYPTLFLTKEDIKKQALLKQKALVYIQDKNNICRELIKKYNVPQQCFTQLYVISLIKQKLTITMDLNTVIVECNNSARLQIHLSEVEGYTSKEKLREEIIQEVLKELQETRIKKHNTMLDIKRKVNKLTKTIDSLVINEL